MNIAVIFAGGQGNRLHSHSRPKQFFEFRGKPIVVYTIEVFQHIQEVINTDPVGIMKCNLLGTINVLEMARHHAAKRVLFASTREVYGKKDAAESLVEDSFGVLDPLDDRSCYPESKRAAESLLKSYALQYGVPFTTKQSRSPSRI